MVDNIFNTVTDKLVDQLFGGVFWIGLSLIIITVLGGLMYYFLIHKRKFDITVKIISDRAEDKNKIIFDKAAILKDRKTKTKYFKLWNLKQELPVPKFNILQLTDKGDYLELYRTGEDDLYFLKPAEIIESKEDVALQRVGVVDQDIKYWIMKRMKDNKDMFDPALWYMKLLPYIPAMITGVMMMFILYIFLDHLPGILAQLKELYTLQSNVCRAATITG